MRSRNPLPHIEAMDRSALAWAAGFFDGEGWAALSTPAARATGQPMAQINQSGNGGIPEVLERFRRAVQVGRLGGPALEEGKLPRYWWVASSRSDVTAAYEAIWPWLGEIKRREFADALRLESVPPPACETPEDSAWEAGLFDGEGWTCLSKHRSHAGHCVIEAGVTQTSSSGCPEVLKRFHRVVTVGKVFGPYLGPEGHAPIYRWKSYRLEEIDRVIGLLRPWLGEVKRGQADNAFGVMEAQGPLPRGNPAWGNRKTHCIHGHEYATARIRRFRGRGKNTEAPRDSHQCLVCLRDHARTKRRQQQESNA